MPKFSIYYSHNWINGIILLLFWVGWIVVCDTRRLELIYYSIQQLQQNRRLQLWHFNFSKRKKLFKNKKQAWNHVGWFQIQTFIKRCAWFGGICNTGTEKLKLRKHNIKHLASTLKLVQTFFESTQGFYVEVDDIRIAQGIFIAKVSRQF